MAGVTPQSLHPRLGGKNISDSVDFDRAGDVTSSNGDGASAHGRSQQSASTLLADSSAVPERSSGTFSSWYLQTAILIPDSPARQYAQAGRSRNGFSELAASTTVCSSSCRLVAGSSERDRLGKVCPSLCRPKNGEPCAGLRISVPRGTVCPTLVRARRRRKSARCLSAGAAARPIRDLLEHRFLCQICGRAALRRKWSC
jgi:hypothetical protein